MESKLIFTAGIIMLSTTLLHIIGGQITLVNPLLESTLDAQVKVEWLGAWHICTFLLLMMGIILTRNGIKMRADQIVTIKYAYYLCILCALSFIGASIYMQQNAPQYILFIPMAILISRGLKKLETSS